MKSLVLFLDYFHYVAFLEIIDLWVIIFLNPKIAFITLSI